MAQGNFFKVKSLSQIMGEIDNDNQKLVRSLGAWQLVLLGVGAIIGAGIFVLTGKVAASYTGPAIVISFAISGLACILSALCYAEFASMIPVAGSAYTYAYASFGELLAFIIGQCLVVEYLVASSAVAVGWSGYVVSFLKDFGIVIPQMLTSAPLNFDGGATGIINLPAVLILLLMTTLLVVGIKASTYFNNAIVFIKITVVTLFLFIGYKYINISNWTPFIPDNLGNFGEFGVSGVFKGTAVVFFSYIGFDAISTTAQETKNPQRDLPIGIIVSLIVCTLLYILVSLVLTGIVNYKELNVPDPFAVAVNAIGGVGGDVIWGKRLIKIGAIAGLSSVVLVLLLGQPRIFMAMSRDGLLPAFFCKIHPKFKTPHVATIITGVLSMVCAGLLPIGVLGEFVCIGTLLIFMIVCLGVLVMRYKRPDLNRPFKTPSVHLVSIGGALFAFLQMVSLSGVTWLGLAVWLILGIIYYFFYGQHGSNLQ